jgi:tetratricopeptide (TPR) repeat protein
MLQTVFDALARRDATTALSAALAATSAEPGSAEAHHALGLALQLAGQPDEAARALDQAIALAPERAAFHLARAGLALNQRDLETVDRALDAAVGHDPNALGAYVMAAHLAIGRGQLEQAEQQVRRAQRVNPEHPMTLCVVGNLALARGDHVGAQQQLALAVQQSPNEPLLLSSLALAYIAGGNDGFAEQALRRSLELQPDAHRLRWLLIESLRRQQRADDLPAALEALVAQAPHDWNGWAQLGESRLVLGQLEPALEAFRRMLAEPSVPDGHIRGMLVLLAQRGLVQHAEALLVDQLSLEPGREALWQARMGTAADQPQALLEIIAQWLAAIPGSAHALQARAALHELLGELAAAEADADAALAVDPKLSAAVLVKLRAELRQQPAAALARLDTLLAEIPGGDGRRVLQMFRGLALDRLGRYDDAATSWSGTGAGIAMPAVQPAPAPAAEDATSAIRPLLLWGPPGSRVRAVAALLRGQGTLPLLEDRFSAQARVDGYGPPRADGLLASIEQWAGVLQQGGVDPNRAIDWLPYYDPRIAAALPDARLVAVLDDPRDLLLNWLAFGAPQSIAPPAESAADWLAQAVEAALARIEAGDQAVCRVDGMALQEPAALTERLSRFLDLPQPLDPAPLAGAEHGLGEVPLAFPPGHWRHYAAALAGPFARLAQAATRLGFEAG